MIYTLENNGQTPVSSGDGTDVYPMGADDGTFEFVEVTPGFDVAVENLPASTSTDADSSTSGG